MKANVLVRLRYFAANCALVWEGEMAEDAIAEIHRLRTALRNYVVSEGECLECRTFWGSEPERHEPNCMAALPQVTVR